MPRMLKILIIEDSEDDALLLIRHLRKDGYDPVYETVDTAEAAAQALEEKTWDIIISDYVLPRFSGLDFLKLLQSKNLDIPCIIVSGKISDEIAVAAMRAGARDYITKDNLKRLGPAVERELHQVEVRRESQKAGEALYLNEAKLGLVMEQMPCILWTTDDNLVLTSLLGAGLRVFNLKPHQMLGKSILEILHNNALQGSTRHAHHKALSGSRAAFESNWGDRMLYCFVEPLYSTAGGIAGVIGVALDVTDKKRAEEELRALSHRLVDTQEIERRTIARELHDEIGQSLTVTEADDCPGSTFLSGNSRQYFKRSPVQCD